jgi:hypothetical protein
MIELSIYVCEMQFVWILLLWNWSCECKDGFTGEACDVNIDECASNPCASGAKCEDLIGSYKCHCPSGKTGADCSTGLCFCIKPVFVQSLLHEISMLSKYP